MNFERTLIKKMTFSEPSLSNLPIFTTQSMLTLNSKKNLIKKNWERDQLLEIHLLEKSARHQNLDCSTAFKQMSKKMETARNSKKCHFEQMQVLYENEQLLELQLLNKSNEKCQLLEL